jgi:hypothetical protein
MAAGGAVGYIAQERALTDARLAAQEKFKQLRTDLGVKSLEVRLGDEVIGSVSIKGAGRTVAWDETALSDLVERTAPVELEESIDPAALEDTELLALLKEARPDLIRRTVTPAFRKKLDEVLADDGTLTDHTTGEIVKVAEITHRRVTGDFSFTPGAHAEEAVLEAWHAGTLADIGRSLVPAAELEPEQADAAPAGPFPTGGAS